MKRSQKNLNQPKEESLWSLFKGFITNKKSLALLMLLLVPIAYVFFYVYAYLDIDHTTQDLQVGIVLEDKGYKNKNLSADLKEKFQENDVVKWKFYDKKENGVRDLKKYNNIYLLVEIPSDLTKMVDNIKEEFNTKKIHLKIYQYNKKNGIIGSVNETIIGKIDEEVRSNLVKVSQDKTFEKSADVKKNIDKLYDGINKLNDGLDTLNDGLNSANDKADEKVNLFEKYAKQFYSSELYNGFPKLRNDISSINGDINSILSNDSSFNFSNSSSSYLANKVLSKMSSKGNKKELEEIKNIMNTEAKNVDNFKNQSIYTANQLKSLNTSYNLHSNAQYIISTVSDESKNNYLRSKINTSKLTQEQKKALNKINEYFVMKKRNIKTTNEGIKTIANSFNNTKNQVKNILQTKNNNIANEMKKVFDSIIGYYNLFSRNRATSEENQMYEQLDKIKKIGLESKKKAQNISNIISLIIGRFDYKNFHTNSKDEIKDIITPVEVEMTDLNKKPLFGAIFFPMTTAIGLWFLLIFMFVAKITKKDLFINVWNNYLNNLIITAILSFISTLILIPIVQNLGINIYNKNMFILSTIIYALSLSSLFMIFYYYTNEYARYILTILLIFNITASGATYPLTNLHPFFGYISPITHFKFYINSVRETLSLNYNNEIFYNNLYILLAFILFNVIIMYIITKIINHRRK